MLVGTYVTVQVKLMTLSAKVQGEPVNAPKAPALLVKLTVPVTATPLFGDMSTTDAVQVVDDPVVTGEVQETMVAVSLRVTVTDVVPELAE